MKYVDLLVRISPRTPPTYGVAVSSFQGSCESTLALPFKLSELAGIVFGVAQTVRDMSPVDLSTLMGDAGPAPASVSAATPRSAQVFGEQLFDALFQGKVRSVFDLTTSAAQEKDVGVRIRLSMDLHGEGMSEVASLPWELIRPRDELPLVVSNQTLLVRSPDTVQPTEPRPFEPPLRILLIESNPEGSTPLNLAEEKARITQIWGPLPDVRVDSCAPVVSTLLNTLRESDYHVIHYMGHGRFDPATGRGALVMAKEDGSLDLVSGEDLAVYLRDELRLLRLVFLNACKTAASSTREGIDPFAGVATALIQAGVPAVVAMQFPISDKGAVTFSETFYQSVARGAPVDVAMAEGRKKLWSLEEWATPVLFLRSPDGVLFEAAVRTAAAAPAADEAWGEGPADAPRVFLAASSEALERVRKQLSKKLRELGVRVVDSAPGGDPDVHAAAVQRLVRGADLSVHLLGDHPGGALDANDSDSLRTWPLQELRIGIEAAPSQLVLIPDTVRIEQVDDPAYATRLQELVHMPRSARQFELVVTDKNQLATETMAKLQRLAAARPAAAATDASGGEVQTALVDVHPADFEHAQDLLRHLSRRNIAWAMTSGQGTPSGALSAFEAGLSKVRLYIVVFGAVAREWVDNRLNTAIQRGAAAESITRCTGVYLAPPLKPGDATRFGGLFDVADNMAGFDASTVDALIARAARVTELTLRDNPYVGLRPFFERDSLYFFGRGQQLAELLEILHHQRFLGVVGSSGSGKSSLVRAGLLPKLLGGFLAQDRDRWRVVRLKPGDAPIGNLASALLDAMGEAPGVATRAELEQRLRDEHTDALVDFLRARLEANANVFVLVDQFEEIFAFRGTQEDEGAASADPVRRKERARRRADAADFVDLLLELSQHRDLPIYVALTMRTDFLGECDLFYGLPEALNRSRYLVPRLTRQQLREAIEGPALLLGARIEPRLVDYLLNELGDRFDRLPVLQHALLRTWDAWAAQGRVGAIDFPHYESAGGLERALDRDAEAALRGLDGGVASALFKRLTDTDLRQRRIRSPARVGELMAACGADRSTVDAIVQRFEEGGRSFVYRTDDGKPDDPRVDLAHESLIRQWDRLRQWVDDERRSRDQYRELVSRARRHEGGAAALLQDPELRTIADWCDQQRPSAAWAERYSQTDGDFACASAYLDASVDAQCQRLAEEELTGRWKIWNPMILLAVMGFALLTEHWLSSSPALPRPPAESRSAAAPAPADASMPASRPLRISRVGELDWTEDDRGRTLDWNDAAASCEGLVAGGRDDWRLPSTGELLDLYDTSADVATGGVALKAPFSAAVASRYLWSGEFADETNSAALAGDFRREMFVPLPVALANEAGALCVASPPPADRADGLANKRRGIWDELTKYTPLGAFVLLYLVLAWAGRKVHRTLAMPGILQRVRATGGRRPDEPGSDHVEAAERYHTVYASTGRRLVGHAIDLAIYLAGVAAVALVLIIVQDVPVTVTKPSGEVIEGILDENDDKTVALIAADGTRQVFPLNPGPRLQIVGGVPVPATLPSGTAVEGRSFKKLQVVVTLPSDEQIEGTLESLAPDRVVLRTAAGPVRAFAIDQNLPDVVIDWPPSDAGLAGFVLFMVILSWLYNAVQLSSPARATLGMRAVGIFRTDLHGGRLSFGRASGWYGYRLLSYLAYLLGFVSQPFTKRRQTFHDWMAGSVVLRRPRPGAEPR